MKKQKDALGALRWYRTEGEGEEARSKPKRITIPIKWVKIPNKLCKKMNQSELSVHKHYQVTLAGGIAWNGKQVGWHQSLLLTGHDIIFTVLPLYLYFFVA